MIKHVIVETSVTIENFRGINMHVFILFQQAVKDGALRQDNLFQEVNSLCNILVKYSPLLHKLEK